MAQSPVNVVLLGESPKGQWDMLRMISNLPTNAIKYGRGKPIELTISSRCPDRGFQSETTAPGFPRPTRRGSSTGFERVDSIDRFVGLGLGLYITRQIVTAHAGTIGIESEVGNGATFIIDLPLEPFPAMAATAE
jgi:signal transduction histidine kinase